MDKPQETKCPLCGGDNHCAMAGQPAVADEPCWCVSAAIRPEVLAAIPEADRGRRCICPACAGVKEEVR